MEILPQLLVNSLISGSIYALASAGLALTYGLLRILNFAHGHIMMVGAYVFYFFYANQGFSLILASLLTLLFSIFLSIVILMIFINPFLRYSYLLPLITTLSLGTILESTISILFDVNVKSLNLNNQVSSYQLAGIYITPIQIVIIISSIALLLIAAFVIHSSSVGRRIRALSENTNVAESIGINRKLVIFFVFAASTTLSMFTGILVGFETNIQPTMGSLYTVKAFAAMILGGLGNIWGTVAGSYILGFIENISIAIEISGFSIPSGYKDAFAFMIILLILLLRPKGLFNKANRIT